MSSVTKPPERNYSLALKVAVVDQLQKGSITCKEAQQRYGIKYRSTIITWLRTYGKPGPDNTN